MEMHPLTSAFLLHLQSYFGLAWQAGILLVEASHPEVLVVLIKMHNVQVLVGDKTEVKVLKLGEDMLRDATVFGGVGLALLGADNLRALLVDDRAHRVAEAGWLAANTGGGLPALLALFVEGDSELGDLLGGDGVKLVVVGCELGLDGLSDSALGDGWLGGIRELGVEHSLDLGGEFNAAGPHQRVDDAVALEPVGELG